MSHIYADERFKIIYCANPKVACSTWKATLLSLHLNETDLSSIDVHNPSVLKRFGIVSFKYLTEDEIRHRLRTYFKFMFSRHPFERLVSAYIDKFTKYNRYTLTFRKRYGRRIQKMYRKKKRPTGNGVTFSEFVRFLTDTDAKVFSYNPHWASQVRLCQPCLVSYDFIGEWKNFVQDSQYIMKVLEKLVGRDVSLIARHVSERRLSPKGARDYYKTIKKKILSNLQKIYKNDLDTFNYTSDEYFLRKI